MLLRANDPVGMRPAALAGIAQAAAQAGDAAHAQAAIDELDRLPPRGRGVGEELGLARAWTAHVSGDRTRAVRIATLVLAAAEARGADGFAARARAELTRLSAQTPQDCEPRCRAKRIVKGSDHPRGSREGGAELRAAGRVERFDPGDPAEQVRGSRPARAVQRRAVKDRLEPS